MAQSGRGTCSVCGSRSTLTPMQVAKINKQLMVEPITVVAARWGVHPSAARRHKLSHALRPIVTDVLVDEDRSGWDSVDTLVAALADSDLIRRQALAAGKPEVALRAQASQQRTVKLLWDELGIDATAARVRAAEVTALVQTVKHAAFEVPVLAKVLQKHAEGDMRAAFQDLYDTATARKQKEAA